MRFIRIILGLVIAVPLIIIVLMDKTRILLSDKDFTPLHFKIAIGFFLVLIVIAYHETSPNKRQNDKTKFEELRNKLRSRSIRHEVDGDCLSVDLPKNFGKLILRQQHNEIKIKLAGELWRINTKLLDSNYSNPELKAFEFINKIYSGEYYLITQREVGREFNKVIVGDITSYENLVANTEKIKEYKIHN